MNGLSVLAPLGLLGLVAVPLIVLLHMRRTTPPVRPVPTLRFWLAARPERTEQTRFRRPPLTLMLLLHVLLASVLGVALARPATTAAIDALGLGDALRTDPRHLILVLDGSTSMDATDGPSGGSRFDAARDQVLTELDDLREGDVATVMVLGTRTTTLQGTDGAGFALLRDRVRDLTPPGGRADLDTALALTRDLLLPGLDDQVVVVTDGALAADPGTLAELGAPVELRRVGNATSGNLAVTEFSARTTPGNAEQVQVYAQIRNFSDRTITDPAVLTADGLEIGREALNLAPGAMAELTWLSPPGANDVTVTVDYPDVATADNQATLLLHQDAAHGLALRILLVSDAPSALQRVLEVLPGAEVTTQATDTPVPVAEPFDLLVFEQAAPVLSDEQPRTPILFVNPPEGAPFATDGVMPQPTVSRIHAQDPLLANVDLAGVTFGETPIYRLDGTQTEVVGAPEGPLVFRGTVNGQPTVAVAFRLPDSNLTRRVAFPILMQNIVASLAPSPLPSAVPLGDPLVYRPRAETSLVRIQPPDADPVDLPITVAPESTADDTAPTAEAAAPKERLREIAFVDTGRPGVYNVAELDAAGDDRGGGQFVVNAGHDRESDLRANPQLADVLATARGESDTVGGATLSDLWPLLVIVGLSILALEWVVALLPGRSLRANRPRPATVGRSGAS